MPRFVGSEGPNAYHWVSLHQDLFPLPPVCVGVLVFPGDAIPTPSQYDALQNLLPDGTASFTIHNPGIKFDGRQRVELKSFELFFYRTQVLFRMKLLGFKPQVIFFPV